jgi:pyruvate carboxylase
MPQQREHSVETIRRNSEVMGNLRKLMVVNRGVSIIVLVI